VVSGGGICGSIVKRQVFLVLNN